MVSTSVYTFISVFTVIHLIISKHDSYLCQHYCLSFIHMFTWTRVLLLALVTTLMCLHSFICSHTSTYTYLCARTPHMSTHTRMHARTSERTNARTHSCAPSLLIRSHLSMCPLLYISTLTDIFTFICIPAFTHVPTTSLVPTLIHMFTLICLYSRRFFPSKPRVHVNVTSLAYLAQSGTLDC